MKNYITYIALVALLFSCAEESKNNSDDLFKKHNYCIEGINPKLEQVKFNLDKLNTIYSEEMKKLRIQFDSIQQVKPRFMCYTPTINNRDKMFINSNVAKLLNDAYDTKYAEFITSLEENLRAIEKCKLIIGEENWYDQSGRTYYQSMIDKYKRN